jgi:glutathione S-transferase
VLTLYSYPELFGVADNNPFGLKVYAFLKLAGLAFRHEHIFDASKAPRGQLPYIVDGDTTVGDSDTIIAHLIARHGLAIDASLAPAQRDMRHLVMRMLDDLYWVMSYSRWKDDAFWPQFRDAILAAHPQVSAAAMDGARAYNFERYRYQGIGRYEPAQAYARGLADLAVIANLVPTAQGFVFGAAPTGIDAAIYGFIANILFYPIATPLKQFVDAHPALLRHCRAIHTMVGGTGA